MVQVKKASIIGFYNNKNEILLQERGSYSKRGEKWAFFGGHLEEGESGLDAFLREAQEELGLDMTHFDYDFLGEYIFDFGDRIYHKHIFLIPTDLNETDFNVYEGESARFFSINDARGLEFPTPIDETLDVIQRYLIQKK